LALSSLVAGARELPTAENDVVFVGMIQRIMSNGGMPQIQNLARALVYQALVQP
jgi:hypothetical protein